MDYSVVFSGQLRPGVEEAEVRANFSRLFRIEPGPRLDRLFSGQAVVLKKGLDAETARKYADTLLRAGAICKVQGGNGQQPANAPAPQTAPAASATGGWNNLTLAPVEKKEEPAERAASPAAGITVIPVKQEAASPYAVSASSQRHSAPAAENNSGNGAASQVPEEARGLAWGAFFFSWLWGPFNGTYLALLCLIPYVGVVVAFYLLFKGRELAWQNKRWKSVEHFNRVQRRWAQAFLVIPLMGILAAVTLPMYGNYRKKAIEAHAHASVSTPASTGTSDTASTITDEHRRILEQIEDPEARKAQQSFFEETDRPHAPGK